MNTENKIYDKIKSAADKGETPNFSSMEKVWNRVEDKLDAEASKSETNKWKKIAVAASLLVLGTLAYNFYFNNEMITPIDTSNEIVTDAFDSIMASPTEVVVEATEYENNLEESAPPILEIEDKAPEIVPNAAEIIQKQIDEQPAVAMADEVEIPTENAYLNNKEILEEKTAEDTNPLRSNFSAVEMAAPQEAYQDKKMKPLVVIDGKAKKEKDLYNINPETIDSIVVLKNPLYIINGVEYTEEELFGKNPTSPYAPLTKQNIISTRIYQGEEATNLYGKKGKEGVVIITTKNGKPKQ